MMILNSQGVEHCGIVYCRKGTRSIGYLVRMLVMLYEVATVEEMKGRMEYL